MTEKKYHFVGVGGIGMSALARILLQRGERVQGSDVQHSALIEELQREGASIRIGHQSEGIDPSTTVVYSSAVHSENVEIAHARQLQIPLLHRSDCLDLLMGTKRPLLVTGTHGKTTTSSLLASCLSEAGLDPSFVLGGIHRTFRTNGRFGSGDYFVAESDESDGSFLKTAAFGAIVTNLEDEHLDYWKTAQFLDAAFAQFFRQARCPEHLFWCGDDARLKKLIPPGVSYGFNSDNELCIKNFAQIETGIRFDLAWGKEVYSGIELSLYGRHNALNGAAVFGLCMSLGISEESVRKAFFEFSGAARRLEWKGAMRGVEVYDDYGHHPTEIETTLEALRGKIRERRLVVAFQPHRYSRVKEQLDRFPDAFKEADVVVMTDIYAAGESPGEGISTALLYGKMRERLGAKLHFYPRTHLEEGLSELLRPYDVLLTIGAGDVTKSGLPALHGYADRGVKWKVAVLFGGTSAEHEVSLMSARRIIDALDRSLHEVHCFGVTKQGEWIAGSDALEKLDKKISFAQGTPLLNGSVLQQLCSCDVIVPVFHGPQGEDGMFQGFLDTLNLPYAGCDYRAGAICMHKGWTKQVAQMSGVPTAPYFELEARQFFRTRAIEERFSYPIWVKPAHLGSSIGISRCLNQKEAIAAAELAFQYDDTILIEKEIDGIQVEYALLGNEFLRAAPSGEILNSGFHDYDSKYGPTACGIEIPARIPETDRMLGEDLAKTMYRATGCKGLARIDFFYDRSGHFWLNEINPFPGFTPTSAYPSMWEAGGTSLTELCSEMVVLAFHRSRRLAQIRGK